MLVTHWTRHGWTPPRQMLGAITDEMLEAMTGTDIAAAHQLVAFLKFLDDPLAFLGVVGRVDPKTGEPYDTANWPVVIEARPGFGASVSLGSEDVPPFLSITPDDFAVYDAAAQRAGDAALGVISPAPPGIEGKPNLQYIGTAAEIAERLRPLPTKLGWTEIAATAATASVAEKKPGLSTGAKVAIGVGALVVLGGLAVVLSGALGGPTAAAVALGRNDREREMWVDNDEGLYRWWRSSRQSKRAFIRENRAEIDQAIDNALGVEPEGRSGRYSHRLRPLY